MREKQMTGWSAAVEDGCVVIRIPANALVNAVEFMPDPGPQLIKVTDAQRYCDHVADTILEFETDEHGTSAIGQLLDRIALEAAEYGEDFIELVDPESNPTTPK